MPYVGTGEAVAAGRPASLWRLFDDQARRAPEAVALVHGGVRLTYRELAARANRFAAYLRRVGVRPEARVGVWADRGFDTMAVLLGIARAGGAYVPVDPATPPARLAHVLAAAGASVLVAWTMPPALDGFGGRTIVLGEQADAIARERVGEIDAAVRPGSLFAVLFTSGTTGAPKGIATPVSSALDQIAGMRSLVELRPGDTSLLHRSFTVVGSIWEHFGPLLHGTRSVILSGDDARDPGTIWRHLLDEDVTHLVLAPTLAEAVIRYAERHHLVSRRLRFSMMAGEQASRQAIAGWKRCFPRARLFICYGTTEASYITLFDAGMPAAKDERPPVGEPFHGSRVYVLDDALQPVGDEAAGDIYVSSPRVARGYVGAPRLTAERFVPDPWAPARGGVMYRTGDRGRRRLDGLTEVLGRRDRQVKIRGFRVELDEVEAAVRRVADGRRAAVVVDGERTGRPTLVAYLETDAPIAADGLRRALRRLLPDHMVPAFVVPVSSIPLTSSGKLDRRALPDPVGAPGRQPGD